MPGQALPSTPVPFVPRRRDGPAPAINPNPSVVGGKRKYDESSAGVGMLGMARVRTLLLLRTHYSYCAHTRSHCYYRGNTATTPMERVPCIEHVPCIAVRARYVAP